MKTTSRPRRPRKPAIKRYDHTNGVLRTVLLDPDVDTVLRQMAYDKQINKNDLLVYFLKLGMAEKRRLEEQHRLSSAAGASATNRTMSPKASSNQTGTQTTLPVPIQSAQLIPPAKPIQLTRQSKHVIPARITARPSGLT